MFSSTSLPLGPLQQAKKRTKDASLAAYISAVFTAVVSVGAAYSQKSATPMMMLPDAALIAGLAYGIQRQSRICAAALVVYWFLAKWLLWQDTPPGAIGIFVAVGFWLSFIGGFLGAVNYHRYKKEPNQTPEPTPGTGAAHL